MCASRENSPSLIALFLILGGLLMAGIDEMNPHLAQEASIGEAEAEAENGEEAKRCG